MALNIEHDLKAANPGHTLITPGLIRGGKRRPNNLLRARRHNNDDGDDDGDDNVSAWFQFVRGPLTSFPTSISHRI